ncbi:MAG: hypothetical protein M3371_00020 [Acidobacteriota bacterium]|nr:hypothetical protein [Acidobacteriota bacterium]
MLDATDDVSILKFSIEVTNMAKHKDILSKLIYMDADFISSKYEEIRNISPETQFSKTEGMKADGGISILTAGIHSQETRTFKLSSVKMLKEIYEELESYASFQSGSFKNYEGTQTVWIEGHLTIGAWKPPKEPDESAYKLFEVKAGDIDYSLIVQPESFSSNIGALLTASLALRANIGIPVKLLGRVLYFVEDISSFVVCPYLIVEL